MSKRAEDAALKAYPYEGGVKGLICENSRQIFIQGYEQAEKDLALTWEDLELLYRLFAEEENDFAKHDKYFYAEVLNRFNKSKEGK